ncbi:MAG TPA: barstar family protein [Amycolatopsis sp.]|nr:barstar family protein [Amycolatopsis sp.]
MTAGGQAKVAADQAFARGAYPHIVDGGTVDKASTLDAIAGAMSFPDYFGRNLDALYDLLTDLSWLPAGEHVLIWTGSEALRTADPKTYLAIRSVLSDAQRALGPSGGKADSWRLTVVLTDS